MGAAPRQRNDLCHQLVYSDTLYETGGATLPCWVVAVVTVLGLGSGGLNRVPLVLEGLIQVFMLVGRRLVNRLHTVEALAGIVKIREDCLFMSLCVQLVLCLPGKAFNNSNSCCLSMVRWFWPSNTAKPARHLLQVTILIPHHAQHSSLSDVGS